MRRASVIAVLTAALCLVAACSAFTDDAADSGPESGNPATTATTAAPTNGTADDDASSDSTATGQTTRQPVESDIGPPVEAITWTDCGSLQCGTVAVPLDYDEPSGPMLDIELVRVPAGGERIGSIFVNPGGPGASGIEFVEGGFRFDENTSQRYDLIGFDPRGIGRSAPLTCTVDRADQPLPDLSPDSQAEAAQLDDEAVSIVTACAAADGEVLPHLTTINVARDLERMRQAVGDEALHYYGLSYGTLLAVEYGRLFPDRVGHLALDGVVDPGAGLSELLRQQAIAFETQFARLDRRCDDGPCPPGGITAAFDRVHDRLEADGPVGGVGSTELVIASLLPAYSPSVFAAYATALDQADGGNFTAIEALSDFFVNAVSFTAYAAFACADGEPPSGPDAWDDFAADLADVAPRFGAVVANELRVCAHWPSPNEDVASVEPTAGNLDQLTRTVLVIGNTNDAATPLENAERVAELLPMAHLVVVDSERHTAYNGSACVRDLVADYFADRLTAGESRCEAE